MKIFVSAQTSETETVRSLYKKLQEKDHVITHDWTITDTYLTTPETKLNNRHEAGARAHRDIQGVIDCDVYILLTDNTKIGKGMYVELGAALALNQTTGSPDIYIVGPMNHMSLFYLHPNATHLTTTKELLAEL